MDKRTFRRARVAVKLDQQHGFSLNCDKPGYGQALLLSLDSRHDALAARLSNFSTSARSRLTLYPIRACITSYCPQ